MDEFLECLPVDVERLVELTCCALTHRRDLLAPTHGPPSADNARLCWRAVFVVVETARPVSLLRK
jgi:hypothetical protein